MGRPTKYDPKFCQTVIDVGEEGGSLTEMASACGVLRETMTDWRGKHEAFDNAVKLAQQASQRWWEERARDATFGKVPGFNATAYIFQMKNRFGHDYSDVQRQEISGPGGQPLFNQITFAILDTREPELKTIDHVDDE
jgi:hypothetical protein